MATYRVTGPDGTKYRVEGPDGASQEEVLSQIQAYRQGPTEPSYVKPGDVAGAKRKLGVSGDVQQGFTNVPQADTSGRGRELLGGDTVLNPIVGPISEAGKGIAQVAGGVKDLVTTNPFQGPDTPAQGPMDALRNIAASPLGQIGLGAVRTVAAPFAPVADLASVLGGGAANLLDKAGMPKTANVVGGVVQSAGDVLGSLGAAGYTKQVGNLIKGDPRTADKYLKSSRMRAREAEDELVQSTKATEAKVASIKSETEQGKRFVSEVADEQKAAIPTAQELKQKFAANAPLGKEAGASWQQGYFRELDTTKKKFNEAYADKLNRGASIETVPEDYLAAAKDLRQARGMAERPSMGPAEGVAERLKKYDNLEDYMDDTAKALREQLRSGSPAEKTYAEDALKEFLGKGAKEMPEIPTVRDLIFERQRLKAGQRVVSSDAAKNQFDRLIKPLENDIVKADETLARELFAVDNAYKKEFVPYFSKGSATRAISEKDPSAVVDMIFQPTVKGGRIGSTSRTEETISRAQELLPGAEWDKVKKAFTNKLIENAMEGGVLNQQKLVKEWGKYLDPAGSNNAVLRKGLGEADFRSMQSTINQLQRSTPQGIDAYAKDLVKGLEKQGKVSTETVLAAQKTVEKRLVEKIARETGSSTEMVTNRLQSIGSGVFVSGLLRGNTAITLEGAGLVVGSKALATVLGSMRGRNAFKALLRAAPGTSQRAAHARIIQQVINQDGGNE